MNKIVDCLAIRIVILSMNSEYKGNLTLTILDNYICSFAFNHDIYELKY